MILKTTAPINVQHLLKLLLFLDSFSNFSALINPRTVTKNLSHKNSSKNIVKSASSSQKVLKSKF